MFYISGLQGETDYEFTDKQSYKDYINRFKGIPDMTKTIIENMRQGMKYKDTIPRMIVLDLRDQYKNALELDLEQLSVPKDVKKDVIKSIEEYILPSVKQLQEFLENEYICKCSDKLGLYSITGGLTIYRNMLEEQTMEGFTPKQIHDLGLREVKRLTDKLNALKRKLKYKGSLQSFYKHYKLPFKSKDQVITKSKQIQKQIYDNIYKKYFHIDLKEKDLVKLNQSKITNHACTPFT